MSESLDNELAVLRDAVLAFPHEARPGPAIPDAPGAVQNGQLAGQSTDRKRRWEELDPHVGQLTGKRVLVVGGDIVYDAGVFATRGAAYVAACGRPDAVAVSANGSSNGSRVAFHELRWEALDPDSHGRFDLVLCTDLLHRVLEPLTLLSTLRRMTAPGGTLLMASMMLVDPERSEYLRFIPTDYAGDSTWQFVPGRLAIRWLLQASGFDVQEEFGEREGPRGPFLVLHAYIRAVADDSLAPGHERLSTETLHPGAG